MDRHRIVRLALWTLAIGVIAGGGVFYFSVRDRPALDAPESAAGPTEREVEAATSRAAAGDVEAQLRIGQWKLKSATRPSDYLEAAGWLRKAAESGNPEAEYQLATVYQAGRGVQQDDTNAVFWFQKAAARQHTAALFNLGSMYEAGRGARMDSRAAAGYMRQAAELGDAYAQYNMARRSEEGHGVTRDLVESLMWYQLAEAGGIEGAKGGRRALESRLTSEERSRAGQGVREFRNRLANKANAALP